MIQTFFHKNHTQDHPSVLIKKILRIPKRAYSLLNHSKAQNGLFSSKKPC